VIHGVTGRAGRHQSLTPTEIGLVKYFVLSDYQPRVFSAATSFSQTGKFKT
jgi:hypothetical protein